MAMFNDNSESAIKNLATLMSMYPDDPVEMTDEELDARDAAALKIVTEMQETCAASRSYQKRLQDKETARQKLITQLQVQEQKKMVERSKTRTNYTPRSGGDGTTMAMIATWIAKPVANGSISYPGPIALTAA